MENLNENIREVNEDIRETEEYQKKMREREIKKRERKVFNMLKDMGLSDEAAKQIMQIYDIASTILGKNNIKEKYVDEYFGKYIVINDNPKNVDDEEAEFEREKEQDGLFILEDPWYDKYKLDSKVPILIQNNYKKVLDSTKFVISEIAKHLLSIDPDYYKPEKIVERIYEFKKYITNRILEDLKRGYKYIHYAKFSILAAEYINSYLDNDLRRIFQQLAVLQTTLYGLHSIEEREAVLTEYNIPLLAYFGIIQFDPNNPDTFIINYPKYRFLTIMDMIRQRIKEKSDGNTAREQMDIMDAEKIYNQIFNYYNLDITSESVASREPFQYILSNERGRIRLISYVDYERVGENDYFISYRFSMNALTELTFILSYSENLKKEIMQEYKEKIEAKLKENMLLSEEVLKEIDKMENAFKNNINFKIDNLLFSLFFPLEIRQHIPLIMTESTSIKEIVDYDFTKIAEDRITDKVINVERTANGYIFNLTGLDLSEALRVVNSITGINVSYIYNGQFFRTLDDLLLILLKTSSKNNNELYNNGDIFIAFSIFNFDAVKKYIPYLYEFRRLFNPLNRVILEVMYGYVLKGANSVYPKAIINDVVYKYRFLDDMNVQLAINKLYSFYFNLYNNIIRKEIEYAHSIQDYVDYLVGTILKALKEEAYDARDEEAIIKLKEAEKIIFNASDLQEQIQKYIGSITEALEDIISDLQHYHIGYPSFDNLVKIKRGDLITIGARPSIGKTSFALNFAANVLRNDPSSYGIIVSLETRKNYLLARFLSILTGISIYRILDAYNNKDKQLLEILHNLEKFYVSRLLIIDDLKSISDITARIRELVANNNKIDFIIVDYLQRIDVIVDGKNISNTYTGTTLAIKQLSNLAKEIKVPIIVLSQLSRDVEKRSNKKPQLSDLRESGAIEAESDVAILMHKNNREDIMVNFYVAKNRDGSMGEFILYFDGSCYRFFETPIPQDYYINIENSTPSKVIDFGGIIQKQIEIEKNNIQMKLFVAQCPVCNTTSETITEEMKNKYDIVYIRKICNNCWNNGYREIVCEDCGSIDYRNDDYKYCSKCLANKQTVKEEIKEEVKEEIKEEIEKEIEQEVKQENIFTPLGTSSCSICNSVIDLDVLSYEKNDDTIDEVLTKKLCINCVKYTPLQYVLYSLYAYLNKDNEIIQKNAQKIISDLVSYMEIKKKNYEAHKKLIYWINNIDEIVNQIKEMINKKHFSKAKELISSYKTIGYIRLYPIIEHYATNSFISLEEIKRINDILEKLHDLFYRYIYDKKQDRPYYLSLERYDSYSRIFKSIIRKHNSDSSSSENVLATSLSISNNIPQSEGSSIPHNEGRSRRAMTKNSLITSYINHFLYSFVDKNNEEFKNNFQRDLNYDINFLHSIISYLYKEYKNKNWQNLKNKISEIKSKNINTLFVEKLIESINLVLDSMDEKEFGSKKAELIRKYREYLLTAQNILTVIEESDYRLTSEKFNILFPLRKKLLDIIEQAKQEYSIQNTLSSNTLSSATLSSSSDNNNTSLSSSETQNITENDVNNGYIVLNAVFQISKNALIDSSDYDKKTIVFKELLDKIYTHNDIQKLELDTPVNISKILLLLNQTINKINKLYGKYKQRDEINLKSEYEKFVNSYLAKELANIEYKLLSELANMVDANYDLFLQILKEKYNVNEIAITILQNSKFYYKEILNAILRLFLKMLNNTNTQSDIFAKYRDILDTVSVIKHYFEVIKQSLFTIAIQIKSLNELNHVVILDENNNVIETNFSEDVYKEVYENKAENNIQNEKEEIKNELVNQNKKENVNWNEKENDIRRKEEIKNKLIEELGLVEELREKKDLSYEEQTLFWLLKNIFYTVNRKLILGKEPKILSSAFRKALQEYADTKFALKKIALENSEHITLQEIDKFFNNELHNFDISIIQSRINSFAKQLNDIYKLYKSYQKTKSQQEQEILLKKLSELISSTKEQLSNSELPKVASLVFSILNNSANNYYESLISKIREYSSQDLDSELNKILSLKSLINNYFTALYNFVNYILNTFEVKIASLNALYDFTKQITNAYNDLISFIEQNFAQIEYTIREDESKQENEQEKEDEKKDEKQEQEKEENKNAGKTITIRKYDELLRDSLRKIPVINPDWENALIGFFNKLKSYKLDVEVIHSFMLELLSFVIAIELYDKPEKWNKCTFDINKYIDALKKINPDLESLRKISKQDFISTIIKHYYEQSLSEYIASVNEDYRKKIINVLKEISLDKEYISALENFFMTKRITKNKLEEIYNTIMSYKENNRIDEIKEYIEELTGSQKYYDIDKIIKWNVERYNLDLKQFAEMINILSQLLPDDIFRFVPENLRNFTWAERLSDEKYIENYTLNGKVDEFKAKFPDIYEKIKHNKYALTYFIWKYITNELKEEYNKTAQEKEQEKRLRKREDDNK